MTVGTKGVTWFESTPEDPGEKEGKGELLLEKGLPVDLFPVLNMQIGVQKSRRLIRGQTS